MAKKKQLIALTLCGMVGIVQAGEKEELLKLRNTTANLIKELVKQGVLTEKVANEMIQKAESDAEQQTQTQTAKAKVNDTPPEAGEVRVGYVPDFVKDDIRQQVRSELRAEVVSDVMQQAKTQKWGMPEALPEWISRFKLSGDLRLRYQSEFMGEDNVDESTGFYKDYLAINSAGGITAAGLNAYLNTRHDRQRFRERLRFGIDAKIAEGLNAGIRLATGNQPDPVSTNQTLGNTGSQFQFNIDRAYLKYEDTNDKGFKWLTVSGGRIANPWYVGGGEFTGGSELVWDTDLSFEGFAATMRHHLGSYASSGEKHDDAHHIDAHSVFATVGAFPLQESGLSGRDKWMFGGQVGMNWGFDNQDAVKWGLAYYDYVNVRARPNQNTPPTCDSNTAANNLAVPQFMQLGNSVTVICNDNTNTLAGMYGLASDYNIINANISYDIARFAPHHIIVSADYAKNLGFNANSLNRLDKLPAPVKDQTHAWQVRADFGWPKVERSGNWNVFAAYKYVERDAVFDAYSDSDFHLGGTNAKGWFVGANYGLMKNVWLTGRWLSADVITGPKYAIDVVQIDINTRF